MKRYPPVITWSAEIKKSSDGWVSVRIFVRAKPQGFDKYVWRFRLGVKHAVFARSSELTRLAQSFPTVAEEVLYWWERERLENRREAA